MYIHRNLETIILENLKIFPVVGISGPRQSGKSTMLKELFKNKYSYVTFDDFSNVDLFHSDPEKFMRINSDKVIFDEVQKVPEIFTNIKIAVDNDRKNYGKFILTGSNQFMLMKNVTESLAGRIGLLTLLPFQYNEIPFDLRKESIFKGCYPEPVSRNYKYVNDWISAYIETYLNRDVRTLINIGDTRDFRNFIKILAARAGNILNMSEISRDIGVSVVTIKKWLSVLEASYIIYLLPPYFKNLGKRIIKSPKLYFYDTGLVAFINGINQNNISEVSGFYGSLFENYVITEIIKREMHLNSKASFYYFRTNHGEEIDMILDKGISQEFIEIKSSETFKTSMIKTIENNLSKNQKGIILHKGKTNLTIGDIKVMNYNEYVL